MRRLFLLEVITISKEIYFLCICTIILLSFVLLIGGCSDFFESSPTYWVNSEGDRDFDVDHAECERIVRYEASLRYFPTELSYIRAVHHNINRCLQSRGWRQISKEEYDKLNK
jgi:hypothetical protein